MSVILYTNKEHKHQVSVPDRRYRARSVLGFDVMLAFDLSELDFTPNCPMWHYEKYKTACERVLGPRFFDVGTNMTSTGQWLTVSKRMKNCQWKFCIFLRSEKVLTLLNLGMTP